MKNQMTKHMTKWLVATLVLTTTMSPSVALADNTAKTGSFADLGGIAQAKQEAIVKASQQGLLDGDPNGQFRPTDTMTRQELAALLVKALHLPLPQGTKSSFADVPQGSWGSASIEAAQQAGLMLGDGNSFRPDQALSREELAAVFARAVHAVGSQGGLDTKVVDQSAVSSWAGDAVDAAVRLGLIDTPSDTLNPQGVVQRQDIAGFLLDIFQVGERTSTITKVEGDVVTIDGKPYLVDEKLKKLLGDRNQQALVGAVLKYKSSNRNVGELSELEIVQNGATLDTSGVSFDGSLRIAADGVVVKGDSLSQVIVKKGVTSVTLDATVKQVVLDTDQKVTLNGNGKLGELQVTNVKGQVTVGGNVSIENVQLPDNVKLSDVISNLDQVKDKIKDVQGGVDDRTPAPAPTPTPQPDPKPVNHKPTVKNAITPVTALVTDGTQTVSLANVFEDLDHDMLTFTSASSATNIATVIVNGNAVVITPVNAGTATITVTATDGKGGTVQTQFNVTFEAPAPVNHDPTVKNTITPVTALVTDGTQTVSLANVFEDQDSDVLTFTAESSATNVATVAINGTDLTLTPVNAGTATITVTANDGNDGNDGTVQTQFNVTFEAPAPVNHDPTVKNTITPVTALVTDGTQTVSLANVFEDQDSDVLTFTAESSATNVATVTSNGTDLTLTPVNAGTATITVTADDGNDGTVQTQFTVTFEAAVPKGLFFSETVYASEDAGFGLQAIELFNPLDQELDGAKITIKRSDGGDDIVLNQGVIGADSTFVIMDGFYGGDVAYDYQATMGFFQDETTPVQLFLYYNDQLVDTAWIIPLKSLTRKDGIKIGNLGTYDENEWIEEANDYTDNLGTYTK